MVIISILYRTRDYIVDYNQDNKRVELSRAIQSYYNSYSEQRLDTDQESLSEAYPKLTLSSIKRKIETESKLDLHDHKLITCQDWAVIVDKMMLLNREKNSWKTLDLTNCYITNNEMVHVALLIAKFEHVKLNGFQTLSSEGWETLKEVICIMSEQPNSLKLKILELKIKKKEIDILTEAKKRVLGEDGIGKLEGSPLQQNVDFSEFDGLCMDKTSLKVISEIIPKLEEVYLDDVFPERDNMVSSMGKVARTIFQPDNKINQPIGHRWHQTWQPVTEKILEAKNMGNLKLKCLGISGCQLNDNTLEVLVPAIVKIPKIYMGNNPAITQTGWTRLYDELAETDVLKFVSLASSKQLKMDGGEEYLTQLGKVLSKMEEADISGQGHITNDLLRHLKQISDDCNEHQFNLKRITLTKERSKKEHCTTDNGYKLDLKIPFLDITLLDPGMINEMV